MLELTDTATETICELATRPGLPAGTGLRIVAQGDDGTDPIFALVLSEEPDPADTVVESEGGRARVFLETGAARVLDSMVLDAQVGEHGELAFVVTEQPAPLG